MEMRRAPNGAVLVTFVKSYLSYQKGQVAGFTEDEARRLAERELVQIQMIGTPPPPRASRGRADDPGDDLSSGMRPSTGPEGVEIPFDWRDMHFQRIMRLARDLGADVTTKADAVAAVELELERRAAAV